MSIELKNWQALCKEKDERIKELEGKFDLIVERLEELFKHHNATKTVKRLVLEVVKEVGGIDV